MQHNGSIPIGILLKETKRNEKKTSTKKTPKKYGTINLWLNYSKWLNLVAGPSQAYQFCKQWRKTGHRCVLITIVCLILLIVSFKLMNQVKMIWLEIELSTFDGQLCELAEG